MYDGSKRYRNINGALHMLKNGCRRGLWRLNHLLMDAFTYARWHRPSNTGTLKLTPFPYSDHLYPIQWAVDTSRWI
ncbi:hypothetical protein TNCV_708921 [Trichonephila clavipes]|nr:hypothetical protein TNCV_708921 [Trichonephila clavipes]